MSSKNLKFDLYKSKYLKYKAKYLSLKKMFGGGEQKEVQDFIEYLIDNDMDLELNNRYTFSKFQQNVTNQFINAMIIRCEQKLNNGKTNKNLEKNISNLKMLIHNTGIHNTGIRNARIHNTGIQIKEAPKNIFEKNLTFPKFSINKSEDSDVYRSSKAEEFIAMYFPCISCGRHLVHTDGTIPWNDCHCNNPKCPKFGYEQYEVKNLTLTKEKPVLENVLDFPGGNFESWKKCKNNVILIFVISELCPPYNSNQNNYQVTNVLVANQEHLNNANIIEISSWFAEHQTDINNAQKSRIHVKDLNKLDIYEWDASKNICTPPAPRQLDAFAVSFVPGKSGYAPAPASAPPAPRQLDAFVGSFVPRKSGYAQAPPPPQQAEPTYEDGLQDGLRDSTNRQGNRHSYLSETPTDYVRGYQDGFFQGENKK